MNKGELKQSPLTEYRMYIVREAAEVLGVSQKLLKERMKSGEIRFMPWGNEKRIPAWELKRWQEAQLELNDPDHALHVKAQEIINRIRPQRFHGTKKVA